MSSSFIPPFPQKINAQSRFVWTLPRWCSLLGLFHFFYAYDLSSQMIGLIGHEGIHPWDVRAQTLLKQSELSSLWWQFPTGLWLSGPSDFALEAWGWGWMGCAFLLTLRWMPLISGLGCLMCSLTLGQVAQPFTSFQWDLLLNEITFVSMGGLIAPQVFPFLQKHPLDASTDSESFHHQVILRWGLRLLLFKVMWDAGLAKILSGDTTWQNLSALDFHFWTQPLPHGGADWAYFLSATFKKYACASTLWIEVWGPFFLLFKIRFWVQGWMGCVLIASCTSLTPTLNNTLCVLVWLWICDDRLHLRFPTLGQAIAKISLGDTLYKKETMMLFGRSLINPFMYFKWMQSFSSPFWGFALPCGGLMVGIALTGSYGLFQWMVIGLIWSQWTSSSCSLKLSLRSPLIRHQLSLSVSLLLLVGWGGYQSLLHLPWLQKLNLPVPLSSSLNQILKQTEHNRSLLQRKVAPWRIAYKGGLFATMTTSRFELTLQGSQDGQKWESYRFKYKPNSTSLPSWTGLSMPRLDWMMWFEALKPQCRSFWLLSLFEALFNSSTPVLYLFESSPSFKPVWIRILKTQLNPHPTHRPWSSSTPFFQSQTRGVYCPALRLQEVKKLRLR